MILMDKTEKFFFTDEVKAEALIEERKNSNEDGGFLIDYKLSIKETKQGSYYIVTLKTRYQTLTEAKASL